MPKRCMSGDEECAPQLPHAVPKMEIIRVGHLGRNLGYMEIVKQYGGRWLTLSGADRACGRLRGVWPSGSGERGRPAGRGKDGRYSRRGARIGNMADGGVGALPGPPARSQLRIPKIASRDSAKEPAFSGSIERRLFKDVLDLGPLREMGRRAKPSDAHKRSDSCRAWATPNDPGGIDRLGYTGRARRGLTLGSSPWGIRIL